MSDPAVCPACKGPMKPLFTGFFCPKDCDRPHLRLAALDKQIVEAQDVAAKPRTWSNPNVWGLGGFIPYQGAMPTPAVQLADDECRDFFCNGKGKKTHTAVYQVTEDHHYQCDTCAKPWFVTKPLPQGATIP